MENGLKKDNSKNLNEKMKSNLENKNPINEEKSNSPLAIENIKLFSDENDPNNENDKDHIINGYEQGSLFYDKYSKRVIFFNSKKHKILIYNRTGEILKKEINVYFDFKVLNASIDKDITTLLIFSNPNINNKFIFVYNISKQIFVSQLKEDYSYLVSMFFADKNFFGLVFVNKIIFYIIEEVSEELRFLKTLDYSKVLIKNFFFVRQYSVLLIAKGDNSYDLYSLRKNEIEIIKSFSDVFETKSNMFKQTSKGFFSSFFSKNDSLKTQQITIINNYNNTYGNIYKTSQIFLEFIYSHLYLIFLSFEDNTIFMMKIKNITKFPKAEDGNKIIKINYKEHSNNSTIQFLDNLMLVHNFNTDNTIIIDIKLKTNNKIVCETKNILKIYHDDSFYKLKILGGNIEEIRKPNTNNKGDLLKKMHSIKVNLENLFQLKIKMDKDIKNKNNKIIKKMDSNLDNVNELDSMLMIARRNKSKIFFLELLNKILIDKTLKDRSNKITILLNEFSRQIEKSNSLALKLMNGVENLLNDDKDVSSESIKLSYKKENSKFYLDDKYIMLSTKNTLSQIEVIKAFKQIALDMNENDSKEENIFEYIFYIFYFKVVLESKKIDVIKLYYDTVILLIKKIKNENNIIKLITFFSNMESFPFISSEIACYFLDTFNDNQLIKLEGYKMLKNLQLYEDLFKYLLKYENISFSISYLQDLVFEVNLNKIKKIFVNYLSNCKEKNKVREIFNEMAKKDDELLESKIKS